MIVEAPRPIRNRRAVQQTNRPLVHPSRPVEARFDRKAHPVTLDVDDLFIANSPLSPPSSRAGSELTNVASALRLVAGLS